MVKHHFNRSISLHATEPRIPSINADMCVPCNHYLHFVLKEISTNYKAFSAFAVYKRCNNRKICTSTYLNLTLAELRLEEDPFPE